MENHRRGVYWKNQLQRRQLLKGAALAGVGGLGLVAVGCGDDDSGGKTPSGGGPAPTAAPTQAPQIGGFEWLQNKPDLTLQPKAGGALKYGVGIKAATLDPIKGSSFESANIYTPVYSRLFRSKAGADLKPYNPWALEVIPDLAASSESPTPGTVTIKLKPNVKWQNVAPLNGRAFTSDDVKFTLESFAASAEFNTAWLPIDKVEAPDASTVKVTLKSPVNYLLPALAEMRIVMLPKEIAQADGDFSKRAVGTGPFILDQYTASTSAHFKKNPDYYVQGRPYLDSVEYVPYKDAATGREAYLTGQFPVGRGDGLGTADQYKDDMSRKKDGVVLQLQSRWQANVWFLGLKSDKPPFNDPRVAQAISKAWDRDAFAKSQLGDLKGQTIGNFTWVDYFDKQPDLSSLTKYDVADAKKLLSAAGITGTLDATIDYAAYSQGLADNLQFIAEKVKEAGINLKLQLSDFATYGPKFSQGLFDNMALGFISTVPRYQPLVMKTFLESTSGRNALKVNDSEIDSNIKKLTESTNAADQKAAYQAIWNKAHLRPYLIPLIEGPSFFFHDKKVHNWLFNQYSDPSGWGLQTMFEQAWLEA
jgi:peptide/nickel transport system substrate-binding protein